MPLKAFGFCYLMIMLIIAGCKKDLTNDLPDNQLSELKNWYDIEKAKSTAKTGSLPGLTPLWNTVISFEDNRGNLVYEVSLSNPNHIFSALTEIDKSKSQEYEKRSLFKLVLIKDKSSGATSGAYMNIIAADNKQNLQAIHYKKAPGFNGNIQYYYITGAFNTGWRYTNGKIDMKYTTFNPFGKGVHTETTIPCGSTPRYGNFCFELEGGGQSCETKIIGYDQKLCQVMSDNPYDGEGEEGGFVPGGPEEPTDTSRGKNFGTDPNCLNCKVPISDKEEFLAYCRGAGLTVKAPFHTTVTLQNGETYEGTITEIRESNGELGAVYFEPDESSSLFEVGYIYKINGTVPSSGNNSSGTPSTLYIGTGGQIVSFESQFPDSGGGWTYTESSAQLLTNLLGLNTRESIFLSSHQEIANEIKAYLATNAYSIESKEFAGWAVIYIIENPEVLFKELSDSNALNITLPNLDASELNSYPKFKALVNDLPNFLTHYPNILKALSLTTGLTEKRIKELMQPGKGPKVIVINNLKDADGNDVVGQFDNKNKILKIDNGYVNDLDIANTPTKYQAIGLILTITTLHEFVHFGRDANNLPKRMAGVVTGKGSYEAGWYFEDIITAPGSNRLEPANAQEWLRYYRVKSRQ